MSAKRTLPTGISTWRVLHLLVFSLFAVVASSNAWAASALPWVDARDFSTFAECVNSPTSAGKTILVSTPMNVGTLTVPADRDLRFTKGGMLVVADGKVLSIAGSFDAPLIQVFSGTGAVTMANGIVKEIYPQWWGAKGDGLHDDTEAIQRAIDARQGQTAIFFPTGNYFCSRTIHITNNRTHLVGSGIYATVFTFSPSGEEVLFDFAVPKAETTLYQCSLKNMGFLANGTTRKVAVRLVNTSLMVIEDISIHHSWQGTGSIGILMHGRELTTIRKATISSDRPIVIEKNLSKGPESYIDCDHLHMQDLYLTSDVPSAACIFIASGVNLTNFVLDGTNAFLLAKYGLYWDDTSSRGTSNNMSIKNIRVEQKVEKNGYAVYISHNYGLQNLIIENVSVSRFNNGFYLRKCRTVSLINCMIRSPSGEALNADDNCDDLAIINCMWQAGSKAKLAGLVEKFSISKTWSASPLPATGFYQRPR